MIWTTPAHAATSKRGSQERTMKLYRFLSGPDDASFCHKVTAALNKGWHLFGSPTYAYDRKNKTMRCGQAVVKYIEGVDYQPGIKLGDY